MSQRYVGRASKFDSNTIQMMKLFRENVRKDITGTNDLIVAVKQRIHDCDMHMASMRQLTNELNLEFASIANKVTKLDLSMKKARIDMPEEPRRAIKQRSVRVTSNSICSSSSSSSLSSIGLDDSGKCPSSSSMIKSNTLNSLSKHAEHSRPSKRPRRSGIIADKQAAVPRLKSSASAHSSLDTTLSWTTGSSKMDKDCDENSDELDNGYGESLIDHDDTFNDIDDDLKADGRLAAKRVESEIDDDESEPDIDGEDSDDDADESVLANVFKIRNSFDDKLLNENCNQLIETLLQNTIAASL